MTTVQRVLNHLPGHRKAGSGWSAKCPAHEDKSASLSVGIGKEGRALVHCHAGCELVDVLEAMGLTPDDLFPSKPAKATGRWEDRIAATYDYTDEQGRLLYQVVRLEPKDFRQRRPEGNTWNWSIKGVRRVVYRLPAVLEAIRTGKRVYMVEGEKDADNLAALGLCSTTNSGGADKWGRDLTESMRDALVVLVPDNDEPGRKHAERIARTIKRVAADVVTLELAGLGDKGDVSDWIAAGGTAEMLEELADSACGTLDPMLQLTDHGNAERLIRVRGKDLRYCGKWGAWLVWDGRRWAVDDTEHHRYVARDVLDDILADARRSAEREGEAAEKLAQVLIAHAKRTANAGKFAAMVQIARADRRLAVDYQDFDTDAMLLNVANGTVDLRTGTLRPHRRDDLNTQLSPIRFDPDAKCPTWLRFLDEIMAGNQELVDFIQRAVGYSLTGDVGQHCLFFCYGTGRNGKGTMLATLASILGDYAKTATPDMLLDTGDKHPTEIADLFRARLVVTAESKTGRRIDEGQVKALTGGDRRKARRMYKDFWEYQPTDHIWLAANHKPEIRGMDPGIWSRMVTIPFEVQIAAEARDMRLAEKLLAEAPGILAWGVRGCLEWQRTGLKPPAAVREASDDYRNEMDVIGGFLDAWCTLLEPLTTPAAKLYQGYQRYCEKSGDKELSQKVIGRLLTERGLKRKKLGKAKRWHWLGVGINAEDARPDPRGDDGGTQREPMGTHRCHKGSASEPAEVTQLFPQADPLNPYSQKKEDIGISKEGERAATNARAGSEVSENSAQRVPPGAQSNGSQRVPPPPENWEDYFPEDES